jgi:hypothetical protein
MILAVQNLNALDQYDVNPTALVAANDALCFDLIIPCPHASADEYNV